MPEHSRYSTIVVDPPWPYPNGFPRADGSNHDIREDGVLRRRTRKEQATVTTRIPLPYPAMELREIAALPIATLADNDARLFLWATNTYLVDALGFLGGWGFQFKQLLVWDKTPNFSPFSGSVAPNVAEFLIVSVRGAPRRQAKWPSSVIRSRKARTTHSRKPDVFLDLVETVSPGPYLELFARRQRLGWDTWGDEALEHVEVGSA